MRSEAVSYYSADMMLRMRASVKEKPVVLARTKRHRAPRREPADGNTLEDVVSIETIRTKPSTADNRRAAVNRQKRKCVDGQQEQRMLFEDMKRDAGRDGS